MSNKLVDIKDQVAKIYGKSDWQSVLRDYEYGMGISKLIGFEDLMDKVAEEYKNQYLNQEQSVESDAVELLFNDLTTWQKETFPNATAISKVHHLKEEVNELLIDLQSGEPDRRLEWADIFLLAFGGAKADGMELKDILDCIREKLEICKKRNWGIPDENGVVKHI